MYVRHPIGLEVPLPDKFIFYMDDFGTRTTCKGGSSVESPANEFSFALGGVIVASEEVQDLSQKVKDFCARWDVPALHGNKIRACKGKFGFLKKNADKREAFFTELNDLILDDRLIAHACVICRPGYRDRYLKKFPDSTRWDMSKTAFDISVERAAKLAMQHERQLDVVFERTGEKEDKLIEGYFHDLKASGMAFCQENSERYGPLNNQQFEKQLNVIWSDGKANALLQLADLIVHPISHIACGKPNRAHKQLVARKMLLDFKHSDDAVGVKYSCYDGAYNKLATHQNTKGIPEDPLGSVGVKA